MGLEEGYYWVKEYEHFPWEIMRYQDGFFEQIGVVRGLRLEEVYKVGDKIVSIN